MGGLNSGNHRLNYRRGRHKDNSPEAQANKNRVQFIIRVNEDLLIKFRVFALETHTNLNKLISDFMINTLRDNGRIDQIESQQDKEG